MRVVFSAVWRVGIVPLSREVQVWYGQALRSRQYVKGGGIYGRQARWTRAARSQQRGGAAAFQETERPVAQETL